MFDDQISYVRLLYMSFLFLTMIQIIIHPVGNLGNPWETRRQPIDRLSAVCVDWLLIYVNMPKI